MRTASLVLSAVLTLPIATPLAALPLAPQRPSVATDIVAVRGPCELGYNFDAFRGLCRPARFGFGHAYRPGGFGGCFVRPTPYGPRRICP